MGLTIFVYVHQTIYLRNFEPYWPCRNAVLTFPISTGDFPDVSRNYPTTHPLAQYIYNLRDYNVVSGYNDGKFYPDNLVTRGQMSKFVKNGLYGTNYVNTTCNNFVDVSASNTFYTDIKTLKCEGIISGFSDNTFKPNDTVTRGQAMKFIIQGVRIKTNDMNFLKMKPEFTNSFIDVYQNYPFYDHIYSAHSHHKVSGYGDATFKPNNPVNRGAMSKMVWNVMRTTNFKKSLPTPVDTSFETYQVEVGPCQSGIPGTMNYSKKLDNYVSMTTLSKELVMSKLELEEYNYIEDFIAGNVSNPDSTNLNYGIFFYSCDGVGTGLLGQFATTYSGTEAARISIGYVGEASTDFFEPFLNIYAKKGNALILLNTTLNKADIFTNNQITTCESISNKDQMISCYQNLINTDSTVQSKIQQQAQTLTSTFALNN